MIEEIRDLSQYVSLRKVHTVDDDDFAPEWISDFARHPDGTIHTPISYPTPERLMIAIAKDYAEFLAYTELGPIAWMDIDVKVEPDIINGDTITATVEMHVEHDTQHPVGVILQGIGWGCGKPARWTRGSKRQQQDANMWVGNAYRAINSADYVAGMVHAPTDPMRGIKRHACAVVRTEMDVRLAAADGDPRPILRDWREWRAAETKIRRQVEIDTVGA